MVVASAHMVTGVFFISFAQSNNNNNNSVREPDTSEHQEQEQEQQQNDIVSYLFSNSVTSMLLSTFIIGTIGALIAKMRTFKKKLDLIEILAKSHIKLKQQADDREKKFEEKFIKSQEEVNKSITGLCEKLDVKTEELEQTLEKKHTVLQEKIDVKTGELEKKIQAVKDESTNALIQYLKESSLGRKR